MPERRPLTQEEWAAVRRRWEGDQRQGFDWLAKEVQAAWGVAISRQGVSDMGKRHGWKKGRTDSTPLKPLAQVGGALAQVLAQGGPDTATPVPNVPLRLEQTAGAGPDSADAYARVREKPTEPSGEAAQNEVADEVVDPDPPGGRRGPGRPTKYRPEFAAEILAYFDKEPYTEVDVPQPSGLVKRQRMATDPPMLAGFARSIGASLRTINRWAVELNSEGKPRYPDFADAYAVARELQEALIARGGLLGLYDTRIAPFILKNLHAWQDHPAKTTDVVPISKEELEATYIRDIEEAHATQDALDAQRREWLRGDGADL